MPEAEKLKLANYEIVNNNLTPLIPQVLGLHHLFLDKGNENHATAYPNN
jgi:hypothetical protein